MRRVVATIVAPFYVIAAACAIHPNQNMQPAAAVSPAETLAYLQQRLVGWSWHSDIGASTYQAVTLNSCLLTITQKVIRHDGTHFLHHEYPLKELAETEWFPGLLPAGSLQVVGKGVRLRWNSEAAAQYTNVDYLELPPEYGERIAKAVNHLSKRCVGPPDDDPFK